MPNNITTDRAGLFNSDFWSTFTAYTGTRRKISNMGSPKALQGASIASDCIRWNLRKREKCCVATLSLRYGRAGGEGSVVGRWIQKAFEEFAIGFIRCWNKQWNVFAIEAEPSTKLANNHFLMIGKILAWSKSLRMLYCLTTCKVLPGCNPRPESVPT